MTKEMIINVSEGEECRIALLEDGRLEELYMERTSSTSHVGNIYKGRVTNVEASIQAAFVDFGLGRNGFLHISDLMPTYFGRRGEDIVENVGKKMARRDRPPIQRCLRRGDDIVVQIIKEGIGTKGPTLSTYLSIPGRHLVMMPGMGKMGISRKIEDEVERRRLRQILDQLEPPEDVGFIIRTAGVGRSKLELERDLKYLVRLWDNLKKKRDDGPGPTELYTEGDLVTRTVRDLFSTDVDRIVVDSKEVAKRVKEVIKLANPRARNRVDLYEDAIPLFHKYNIEREIELMYSRHVPLPSGGSLVIDSTEAIVAIDVNSGKFRDHSDAEMTAFKTDMEAAEEIPRQLRLRDLGGVIICDFIDLRYERHRRELEKTLHDNFKKDRAKSKILRMSQFGIIEMTRQRMRPSLKRSIYFDCPHCKGAGLVKTPESMALDVMRRLAIATHDQKVQRVELTICPEVNFYLQNRKRQQIADLEAHYNKRIVIQADPHIGLDEMKLELFDARDGLVMIDELHEALAPQPHRTQLATRPHTGAGTRNDRRQQAEQMRRPPGQGRSSRPAPRDDDDEDDRMIDRRLEMDRDDVPERSDVMDREADQEPDQEQELSHDEHRDSRDERADPRDERRDARGDRSDPRDERRDSRDERREPQQGSRGQRHDPRDQRHDPRRRPPGGQRPQQPQQRDSGRRDDREFDAGRRPGSDRDRPVGGQRAMQPAGRDLPPENGQNLGPTDDRNAEGFGEEGGPRRRRRRRRRRGRGRGGQQQNQPMDRSEQDRPGEPIGESLGGEESEDAFDRFEDEAVDAPRQPAGELPFASDSSDAVDEAERGGEPDESGSRWERQMESLESDQDEGPAPWSEPVEAEIETHPDGDAAAEPAEAETPASLETEAPAVEPEPEAKPKRRRRTATGTAAKPKEKVAKPKSPRAPRRKKTAAVEPEPAPSEGAADEGPKPPEDAAPAPRRRTKPTSSDSHLMQDDEEPMRPSRRLRSSRDLDDIPDDLF